MTERYSFAVDRHLVPNISVDESVVWNHDNIDAVNSTLTDTINEGYVTAEEDSPTQYLSVLDSTSEISLENLNITLANPKLEVEETADNFITDQILDQVPDEINDQQVVVYTVEGSDELYGIQVAQDEDGNYQKYQFQFRKNEEGQLEAIPETIQLLPMEEDVQEGAVDGLEHVNAATEDNASEPHSVHIFVQEDNSGEHILPDNCMEQEQNEEEDVTTVMYENEEIEEESVDIKPGILCLQSVKQELQEHQDEYNADEAMEEAPSETFAENLEGQQLTNFSEGQEPCEEVLMEYHNQMGNSVHVEENSVSSEAPSNEMTLRYEEKESEECPVVEACLNGNDFETVEVNPDVEPTPTEDSQEETEDFTNDTPINDSDVEDYHIVEGLHITGDVEPNYELGDKHQTSNNTNILRQALKNNKEQQRIKKDNKFYLYVVQHPEKENVDSLSLEMSNLCRPKVNPRSILKSSHAMFQAKNEMENDEPQDERLNKRFARCKEAMQARIFHNFINKTTIPQAPVRKDRLPRKQKIKPVERIDEEIVVQEVMVSSNRFVEMYGGAALVNKENLEVTDYVELTDSDDDYEPKKIVRKKKKHRRKKIEITISDESDESRDSVIELDESEEESPNVKEEVKSDNSASPTKRRRGRPPKNHKPSDPSNPPSTESPAKKSRLEAPENPTKPEIPCPKCNKTFPSQNSLKTHLQHHSLQSSIKNALPEYKYKCDHCAATFKNNILLKKHSCPKAYGCSVCKKRFPDVSSLNGHKRIHAKEQLLKSTTAAHVSPKKMKPVPSAAFKSPKRTNSVKCKTCGKVCSSAQNLSVHMKTHREYICGTCSLSFVSQLVLEKHVRENCVKSPQVNRRSTRIKSTSSLAATAKPAASTLTASCTKVKCDNCTLQFGSHQALFKHKVLKHGLDTPDKKVLEEEEDTKGVHGGVPAAKRLKNAYSGLRCQLDFTD
jgi:hypothetical protein